MGGLGPWHPSGPLESGQMIQRNGHVIRPREMGPKMGQDVSDIPIDQTLVRQSPPWLIGTESNFDSARGPLYSPKEADGSKRQILGALGPTPIMIYVSGHSHGACPSGHSHGACPSGHSHGACPSGHSHGACPSGHSHGACPSDSTTHCLRPDPQPVRTGA